MKVHIRRLRTIDRKFPYGLCRIWRLYMAKQPRHTGTSRRGCIFSFPVDSSILQAVHARVMGSLAALPLAACSSAPIAGWVPPPCAPSVVPIGSDPRLPAGCPYPGGHPIGCGANGLGSLASAGRCGHRHRCVVCLTRISRWPSTRQSL